MVERVVALDRGGDAGGHEVAGPAGRLFGELLLAAGEVVVDGAARRAGVLEHVGEGGALDAALAEEQRGALDHAYAGVGLAGHRSLHQLM